MKNPLKILKHLVKDPVTTIAEVDARKKEIMPWLLGSVALGVLGCVLGGILELGIVMFIGMIGLLAALFFGFLIIVANKAKQKFEAMTCSKCNAMTEIKTAEDFAKYVSYTVEKDVATFVGYSGNKEPTNGVYSMVKYTGSSSGVVSVALTCSKCGEVKHLKYTCTPFQCHAEAKNVGALHFKEVAGALETSVRTAVNDYNNPEKNELIPYSIHSSKNPHFAERETFKGANAKGAHPDYMGATIDKRQDVDEMLAHFFVLNQLNGKLVDPSKSKK